MARKAPGRAHRKGISLVEIMRQFPDDATAEAWFVERRWPDGIALPLLWVNGRTDWRTAQDDAVPLQGEGVRQAVQRENRHGHGRLQARLPDLDDRHVPAGLRT